MLDAGVYSGSGLTSVDAKGRVSVPACLRKDVPGEVHSRSIYVSASVHLPYLYVSGAAMREIQRQQISAETRVLASEEERKALAIARSHFGTGEVLPMDSSGRFVMPDIMKAMARFAGNELLCFGDGDSFQIWCVQRLAATTEPEYANARFALECWRDVQARKA